MTRIEVFLPQSVNTESLEEELHQAGAISIATMEVRLFSKNNTKRVAYRGVERMVQHSGRHKVEVLAPTAAAETIREILHRFTDKLEGSKIFISEPNIAADANHA